MMFHQLMHGKLKYYKFMKFNINTYIIIFYINVSIVNRKLYAGI